MMPDTQNLVFWKNSVPPVANQHRHNIKVFNHQNSFPVLLAWWSNTSSPRTKKLTSKSSEFCLFYENFFLLKESPNFTISPFVFDGRVFWIWTLFSHNLFSMRNSITLLLCWKLKPNAFPQQLPGAISWIPYHNIHDMKDQCAKRFSPGVTLCWKFKTYRLDNLGVPEI